MINNDNIWWLIGIITGICITLIILDFIPKQEVQNKTIRQHLSECCGIRMH